MSNPNEFLESFAESTDVIIGLKKQFLFCRKCGRIDFQVHKTSDGGIEFSCSTCSQKGQLWNIKLVPTINLEVDEVGNEKS